MARAVREFYSDLKYVKHNDPDLPNALKLRKRCLDSLEANDFTEPPTKVKFRQVGGGRKNLYQKFARLFMIGLLSFVLA